MARDPRLNRHVARVIHARFVTGKTDSITALSERSGIPEDTLYDYAENRRDLPARQLPRIAHGEADLFAALSGASAAGLVVSLAESSPTSASLQELALEIGAESGKVLGFVAEAVADGKIVEVEEKHLEHLIGRLTQKLEQMRAKGRGLRRAGA